MPRMRKTCSALMAIGILLVSAGSVAAQQQPTTTKQPASTQAQQPPKGKPEETEVWEPVPPIITPGATNDAPPSDAIVLFNGKNLDEWVSVKDKTPAKWIVADGVLTVDKAAGNIETKRSFRNYQLHLEWRIPTDITGQDQARGNSGL